MNLPVPAAPRGGPFPVQTHERLQFFHSHALRANTVAGYAIGWSDFSGWCASRRVNPLPAPLGAIASYLSAVADARGYATLKNRRASIRYVYTRCGLGDPFADPLLIDVWVGIRRTTDCEHRAIEGMRLETLLRLVRSIPEDLRGLRDRAAILVGYTGMLTTAAIRATRVEQLHFSEEGVTFPTLVPFPYTVAIARGSNVQTCPVHALQRWLLYYGAKTGPLFPRFVHDRPGDRERPPLLQFNYQLRRRCSAAGIDTKDVAFRVLRTGCLLESAARSMRLMQIMRYGAYKKPMNAYQWLTRAQRSAAGELLRL